MADPVSATVAVGWAMSVAGWVVSPIISDLYKKGSSYLGFDPSQKLKDLEPKVLLLQRVIEILDESPDRPRLEQLFKDLKSAFYEAEDILDLAEYHNLERKIKEERLASGSSAPLRKRDRAKKKFQSARLKISTKYQRSSMSKRMFKKSLGRIEKVVNDAYKILKQLTLPSPSNHNGRQTSSTNYRNTVTTGAPPLKVFGRDKDRDMIIGMLHDNQPNINFCQCYSVLGIHGIGGFGKSTLAQLVYDREKKDKEENKDGHFDLIMWVHVSQNFSVDTIFKEMYEGATGKECPKINNRNTLEENLKKELHGKRFLLVLDDVWYNTMQVEELQKILSPLSVGKVGSKILATSRTKEALSALHAVRSIPISDLDDEVFVELFMHYALGAGNIDSAGELETIGAEIAKKLKGSALAARIVGGQLCTSGPNVESWKRVRDSDLLNKSMGALWWSYHNLNEEVKQCFAYCSIFPRRYHLRRDELVNFWVAEGFIRGTNDVEKMEDISQKYFDELVSSSFLQLGGKDIQSNDYYLIHDLLHDLAENVSGSDCFRIENGWTRKAPKDVRHLFVETGYTSENTQMIFEMKNLRTLIVSSDALLGEDVIESVIESIIERLPKLRVLFLDNTRTTSETFSFPESIYKLKHLRYLHVWLSGDSKLILPSTFTNLYQLQVVDFGSCRELSFPSGEHMANLINLRHIVSRFACLAVPNIGRLTSLQTIPYFPVRKEPAYELKQLKNLNKLRGRLWIAGLENVERREEALEANVASKEHVTELRLHWPSYMSHNEEEVIEDLCPPLGLRKLIIWQYHGARYPNWMVGKRDGHPKHLHELMLHDCSRPAPEVFKVFVHLQSCRFSNCNWSTLPDNMEHLTSLKKLVIHDCNSILLLPTLPMSLQYFELTGCHDVLMRSCLTYGDPDWQKIQHIPEKKVFR